MYGPLPELQDAYDSLRSWFMQHYTAVRQTLKRPDSKALRAQIATWSLDSSSADRLFRLLEPTDLEGIRSGWQVDLDRLLKDAQSARKAAKA